MDASDVRHICYQKTQENRSLPFIDVNEPLAKHREELNFASPLKV